MSAASVDEKSRPPSDTRWTRVRDVLSDPSFIRVATIVIASRIVVGVAFAAGGATSHAGLARRWDGSNYADIARRGYPPQLLFRHQTYSNWAFFPVYPMMIRIVHRLTGLSLGTSALLINVVGCACLAYLMWRLCAVVAGRAVADRASALFWFFPGSAVLSMAYSETLFLAFACAALLALVRRRWWLAGFMGALASATRPSGIAVIIACAATAAVAIKVQRDWRSLVAPLLACVGIASFVCWGYLRTGNPLIWRRAEGRWHQTLDFSLRLPLVIERNLAHHSQTSVTGVLTTLGLIATAGALLLLIRDRFRLPLPLLAYLAAMLVLDFSSSRVGPRPRFVLVLIPLFIVAARQLGRRAFVAVLITSTPLLALTAYAYTGLYRVVP